MKTAYRFYNFVVGKHGNPFGLCNRHEKTAPIPPDCIREKLGDNTGLDCDFCEHEEVKREDDNRN